MIGPSLKHKCSAISKLVVEGMATLEGAGVDAFDVSVIVVYFAFILFVGLWVRIANNFIHNNIARESDDVQNIFDVVFYEFQT